MRLLHLPLIVVFLAQLASCGGGDGGGAAPTATAPAPVTGTTPTTAPTTTPATPATPSDPVATPTPVTNPDPTTSPTPAAGKNVLFVGDAYNNVIAAFDVLAPAGSGTVTGKVLTSDVDISSGGTLDRGRNLLYVNAFKDVNVFANASDLTGKIAPTRTFTPIIFPGTFLSRMTFDSVNDRLYIAYGNGPGGAQSSGFAVFDNASTLQGNVTPTRLMNPPGGTSNYALDLKRGLLYSKIENQQNAPIYVFEHIDTASGSLPVARRIALDGNVVGIGIDADRDILYAGLEDKGLTALHDASKASSFPTAIPTPIISVSVPSSFGLLVTDPRNDRLYISFDLVNGVNSKAYILNDASTLGQSGHAPLLALTVAATTVTITSFTFF